MKKEKKIARNGFSYEERCLLFAPRYKKLPVLHWRQVAVSSIGTYLLTRSSPGESAHLLAARSMRPTRMISALRTTVL